MRPSPFRDLRLLWEGLSRLTARPGIFLGMTLLSTAFLALSPLLRVRLHLPADQGGDMGAQIVAMLPLEIYALPRLLAYLDAQTRGHEGNPKATWQETFESRWWRSTLARLSFFILFAIGIASCVVPGLFVLLAFGWAPTRILLRGDGLREGFRGSARLMLRAWPRVVFIVLVTYFLQVLLVAPFVSVRASSGLSIDSYRSLGYWGQAFLTGALGIWFSSVLLALFQAVEEAPGADSAPDQPSGK